MEFSSGEILECPDVLTEAFSAANHVSAPPPELCLSWISFSREALLMSFVKDLTV